MPLLLHSFISEGIITVFCIKQFTERKHQHLQKKACVDKLYKISKRAAQYSKP